MELSAEQLAAILARALPDARLRDTRALPGERYALALADGTRLQVQAYASQHEAATAAEALRRLRGEIDLPIPEPGPGLVLIHVSLAGMNFSDTHTRENQYIAKADLPLVPGGEVAGVRVDTGERVVALTGNRGGYAEYAVADADRVWPVPDAVDDGTALALVIQGLTAWHLYRTSAQLRAGESVVVQAAAGGMGTLLCQLGHPMGAGRVIAVASTPEKRELALELGADVAIDADPEGMGERLLGANGGTPVDVVFEMVGGRVFDECLAVLAPFGRLIAYGIATREQKRGAVRIAHEALSCGRRLRADAPVRAARDGGRGVRRPVRAGGPRRASRPRRRDVSAERGGAGPGRPRRSPDDG